MAADELDDLVMDRFGLHRSDFLAALKTLPAHRPGAAALSNRDADLLDAAGFTEDHEAYTAIAADVTAHTARLYRTAYSAAEVRTGLGVSDSRVRQRRLARTLWALDDGRTWVYPALQFQASHGRLKLIRGLEQVLPALLARDAHPASVAGFLLAPQPDLRVAGQPTAVLDWLERGEPVEPVVALIEVGDWAAR